MVIAIVAMGGSLRLRMADVLPSDWDEDNYLIAAAKFRELYDEEDWDLISQVRENYEHPPLVKMLYALALDGDEVDDLPENAKPFTRLYLPENSQDNARLLSVILGTTAVLAVALVFPLGGLALALHSIHVHFTSVAYLEPLPMLFSALTVIFYNRFLQWSPVESKKGWWTPARSAGVISGICLGIAAAAKYPYAVAGIAVTLHSLYFRVPLWKIAAWGFIALIVFFIFNPFLWPNPTGRLESQLTFHEEYAERQQGNYDFYKPITQFMDPRDHWDYLGVQGETIRFFRWVDFIMFLTVLPGAFLLLQNRSVYGVWFVLGFVVLMHWSTQWIQHKMIVLVPYSIAAAYGMEWFFSGCKRLQRFIHQKYNYKGEIS